jgi:PAS domain S-box-containing protein
MKKSRKKTYLDEIINPKDPVNGKVRASLELLYHVSREFAAAPDLRTVLERVLLLSMQTVGATSGSIIVVDDNGKPVESALITGSQVHDHTTQRLLITLERGLAGWVARNQKAALVTDTRLDQRWLARRYDLDEPGGTKAEPGGTKAEPDASKSAVSVPIMARDRLVGVVTLAHKDAGFFTTDHLALIQAIADQAGLSILNARLYAESQRQARVMTALAESATAITATLDLEDVLKRILEQIIQVMRVQAVSLALMDPLKEELVFRAAIGWPNQGNIHTRLKLGTSIVGWAAKEGQGLVVPDVREDPRYDAETEQRTGLAVNSIACVPISSQDQVIGVLEALNPVGGIFDLDALPVLTGIGSLAGTAIRHAQLFERLQAAHQRFRELFEDSIDLILISDWQGRIIEANRQAVYTTGFEAGAIQGMMIGDLHQLEQDRLGQSFERLSAGEPVSYESVLHTRGDRGDVPIQVYARKIQIEEVPHIQWILRDISERKHLDTVRDDLLSMIYHDLQSPLSNVKSSLDLANTMITDHDDPTLKYLMGIASRSTERVQRLINSLLDISRLEAGQPIGNRQPTEITGLVKESLEIVLPTLEAKHQQLQITVPPGLPEVLVDADMIRRTLSNLVENAVKFSPPGSHIQISGSHDGDWVYIWVQDNGPGIPAGEHERIFLKYTRLNYQDSPKGLGLGLAYCRLAIEGHGGCIWVDSEVGKGARFTFTLPIAIK